MITVEIVELETEIVVKRIECGDSIKRACKIDDGVQINLNHEKYYTRILGITTKEIQP